MNMSESFEAFLSHLVPIIRANTAHHRQWRIQWLYLLTYTGPTVSVTAWSRIYSGWLL